MELLIRIVDKHPIGHELHDLAGQAGDVISACPDNWDWSQRERENPDWIILKSDLLDIEADMLLASARPYETQYKRRNGIDVTGYSSGDFVPRAELMGKVF